MKHDSMISFIVRVVLIPVMIILFMGSVVFTSFVGASKVSEALNELNSAVEVCAAELNIEEVR